MKFLCKNCNIEIIQVECADGLLWFHRLAGYVDMWCHIKYAEPQSEERAKGQVPLEGLVIPVEATEDIKPDPVAIILDNYDKYINTKQEPVPVEMQNWFKDMVVQMGMTEDTDIFIAGDGTVYIDGRAVRMTVTEEEGGIRVEGRPIPSPTKGSEGAVEREDPSK